LGHTARVPPSNQARLSTATVAAVGELLQAALRDAQKAGAVPAKASRKAATPVRSVAPAVAIVCAGRLARSSEAEQDYRAAFGFAARHKLPILYLVGNTLGNDRNTSLDLRSVYPEFGMPLFTVDAADAIAAYRVATEALHNARQLRGPCVIEALALTPATNPLALLAGFMERHGVEPR